MNNDTNDENKKDIDFYNKKSSTSPCDLAAISVV